jgi:hypothetical protein
VVEKTFLRKMNRGHHNLQRNVSKKKVMEQKKCSKISHKLVFKTATNLVSFFVTFVKQGLTKVKVF